MVAPVIAVHSFQRGTGKSHLAANLAVLLVQRGLRVGLVDTSLHAPALHILLRLPPPAEPPRPSFAAFILEQRPGTAATLDRTSALGLDAHGRLFVLPASTDAAMVRQVLQHGYSVEQLEHGLHTLTQDLALDVLVLDTDAGVQPETLVMLALCDTLLVLLRLDPQDYQGTGVLLDVARQLDVRQPLLIVNQAPALYSPATVLAQVAHSFATPVAAVLPHFDELAALASSDVFVLRYPQHPMTHALHTLARRLP